MATGFGILTVVGLYANYIFTKFKLPGLLGMLLLGMLIGLYGLDWDELKKVGKPAIKLSLSREYLKVYL